MPDISLTFHVVKYLGGDVPDWPRLLDTLLAVSELPYPQGWRQRDGYLNHDIYDVVTLFRLGWRHADARRREAIRAEVGRLLDGSLAHTIEPRGVVRLHENDDSIETATSFAVGFLDEVGDFDRAKRFWTDRDFPEAPPPSRPASRSPSGPERRDAYGLLLTVIASFGMALRVRGI